MIKTAAIFPAFSARNSGPVMAAVRSALQTCDVAVQENCMDSDAAIIWSVLWDGRMAGNRTVYDAYRQSGRPVIIIDIGTLVRGVTWKIAMDNINALGWFGDPVGIDPDRPSKLGLPLQPQPPGTDILIASQHRRSLQAEAISEMERWVYETVDLVRRYSDRPIKIRPHPRDPLTLGKLPTGVVLQVPTKIQGTYDSFDWSNRYHAVVNHNSGPGVLAALAGVPVVVHKTSLAWPVSVNMKDIERPHSTDRDQWLISIAHTEYTLDEIVNGLWLRRLGSRL